jgi:hypothetical protein
MRPERLSGLGYRYGDGSPITIQQVVAIDRSFAALLKMLFFSSGEAGYNGADDAGIHAIGLPATIMPQLATSADALPAASGSAFIYIAKPTSIGELIGPELMLRRALLVWRNQSLQFTSWQAPVASRAVAALDETNKADPASSSISQRSATTLSTEFMRNVIKVKYNRDRFTDQYTNSIAFEDRTSIDDHGGMPAALTITAPSYYTSDPGNDLVFRDFLAMMPFFSRPLRLLTRSISPKHYESLGAGDIVTITDGFARDPISGQRGVINRPGVVISHRYNIGGAQIDGTTQPMVGEVVVALSEMDRSELYSPAAELDYGAITGGFTNGYNAGTSTLRLSTHAYSETPDAVDAAQFLAGDKLRIIEIDPADPAAPTTWTRTVANVSGSDLVLTAALASPAFVAGKRYRIFADTYAADTTSQQANAFQADTATGKIIGSIPAKQYAANASQLAFTPYSGTLEYGEVIPAASHATDAPLDSGIDYALATNADWLLDHYRAVSSPVMMMTPHSFTSGSGTYKCLCITPIWLGRGASMAPRFVKVRPWFASVTGASVTIRVSLVPSIPVSDNNIDLVRASPMDEASWTSSSTAYIEGAEASLAASVVTPSGWAFLMIEGTLQCITRGLSQCHLSART